MTGGKDPEGTPDASPARVGFGFDAHAFDDSRPLVLGGVTIAGARGLVGWSDADVLSHALADALLGAAGLGDLGTHFPAEAVAEGCSSLELLGATARLVSEAGLGVANADCLVILEGVRVAPYRGAMERLLASALGVDAGRVNVKATSTDHLGFVGRGEGAAAMAVVLLKVVPGERPAARE
ncbi:MAG: 2-C-methyl-D-erythritol 2,4-cyclodiphosphate synthase [Actinomycetota bacterium]